MRREVLLTVLCTAVLAVGAAFIWMQRYQYVLAERNAFVLRIDRVTGSICWIPFDGKLMADRVADYLWLPQCPHEERLEFPL